MTIYGHECESTAKMEDSPVCLKLCAIKNKLKQGSQVFRFYGSLRLDKKPYIKTHFPPPPQPLVLMAKSSRRR